MWPRLAKAEASQEPPFNLSPREVHERHPHSGLRPRSSGASPPVGAACGLPASALSPSCVRSLPPKTQMLPPHTCARASLRRAWPWGDGPARVRVAPATPSRGRPQRRRARCRASSRLALRPARSPGTEHRRPAGGDKSRNTSTSSPMVPARSRWGAQASQRQDSQRAGGEQQGRREGGAVPELLLCRAGTRASWEERNRGEIRWENLDSQLFS